MTRRAELIPVLVEILLFVEHEVLDQRLAINAHAPLCGPGGSPCGSARREVFAPHKAARRPMSAIMMARVGVASSLDLGRARIGCAPARFIAFGEQLLLKLGDHVAILRMHHRQAADLRDALERRNTSRRHRPSARPCRP